MFANRHMLDDDRSFFYSGAYGFLTRTGQCDDGPKQGASRVYGSLPSREPFSADNSSGSSTLRAGVLLYRARLLQNSQLGFDLVIDLLRVRIKGSGNTNPNARPHG